jgi:hypothetical protein
VTLCRSAADAAGRRAVETVGALVRAALRHGTRVDLEPARAEQRKRPRLLVLTRAGEDVGAELDAQL